MERKKIRFIPLNEDADNPVNRMRCFDIIQGLKDKGYNVGIYRRGEEVDAVITLNMNFAQWLKQYNEWLNASTPLILNLAENEFERSAIITAKKLSKIVPSYEFNFKLLINKIKGFIRRRNFDRFFYNVVRRCSSIVGSSQAIADDAKKYNKNSYYIPDAINLKNFTAKESYESYGKIVVGWTGMATSVHYLLLVNKALKELQQKHNISIVIITSQNYREILPRVIKRFAFRYQFVEWRLSTIAENLAKCDLAIAPLPEDSYKSNNKVATYWAAGLPIVASATKEYKKIITNGENGFIANTQQEWYQNIEKLIMDQTLRKKMGLAGKQATFSRFSVPAITKQWEDLLNHIIPDNVPLKYG